MIHKNLNKSDPGRGIIMYVRKSVDFSELNFSVNFVEYLSIEIMLSNNEKLLLNFMYRSPNSSDVNNLDCLKFLKHIHDLNYSYYAYFGDFNFSDISWEVSTTDTNSFGFSSLTLESVRNYSPENIHCKFIETIQDCFLFQHITMPTRGRESDTPSTLGLF